MKNERQDLGIKVLFGAIVVLLAFFFYYYLVINKFEVKHKEKEVVTYSDEEIKELYNKVKLNLYEEYPLVNSDYQVMDKGLSMDNITNNLILTYGLKLYDRGKVFQEKNARKIVDKEGYVYTGSYISTSYIKNAIDSLLVGVKVKYVTMKFPNIKYVYDEAGKKYRIYEKTFKYKDIEKHTYMTSTYDDTHIYITEYVAYTKLNSVQDTSYTRHNNLLPINITDDNITENLDIIDKYKYTFTYNENVGKFFLSNIDYLE